MRIKTKAIILMGGQGKRLYPITQARAKPAVPIHAVWQLGNYALANHYNSGTDVIQVITQYESQSLQNNIKLNWELAFGRGSRSYLEIIPAFLGRKTGWYRGTADAVSQNLDKVLSGSPGVIYVFGADHVYYMDTDKMLQDMLTKGAEVIAAAKPVSYAEARGLGVFEVNQDGKIIAFHEKVENPPPMPEYADLPREEQLFLGSMGNYGFLPHILESQHKKDIKKRYVDPDSDSKHLLEDRERYTSNDYANDIFRQCLQDGVHMYAYDFRNNDVPGVSDEEQGYWYDAGTIPVYVKVHNDAKAIQPKFNIRNKEWPVSQVPSLMPGKQYDEKKDAGPSLVAPDVYNIGGWIDDSCVGLDVKLDFGSHVKSSILFGRSIIEKNAYLENVIADRDTHFHEGARVGVDSSRDLAHGCVLLDGGMIYVPQGVHIYP